MLVRDGIGSFMLQQFCNSDETVALLSFQNDFNVTLGIVMVSGYFPYDATVGPPSSYLRNVRYCERNALKLIVGCDANAQSVAWGSSNTNTRSESFMEFIMEENLICVNVGNEPTFAVCNREEVIDITFCNKTAVVFIRNWHVSSVPSLSDHRYLTSV